ncbi:MAG: ABC transporter ATP-binding protein [Phycisphaerales bacterium]|nr:ABC transporter ATP-binding protein [Phycisphaerales bacterium]
MTRRGLDNPADVVVIDRLSKHYGATRALDEATFTMRRGQLLGFLGPNGAGKSTAIRLLMGLLKPTAGRSLVFGLDPWRQVKEIHARVGYLSGDVRLYRDLTGRQTVRTILHARRLSNCAEAERLAESLRLDLRTRVRHYSTGMKQKLGIVLALMHRPELLILDEPTAALDPLMQQVVYRELRAAAREGRSVLFSSHSLAEVESLCEHVVILRSGRVVAATSMESLKRRAGRQVSVRLPPTAKMAPDRPTEFVQEDFRNGLLRGRWTGPASALLNWLAALSPEEVVIQPPNLEDVFLNFYQSPADVVE